MRARLGGLTAVSGVVTWDRRAGTVRARLRLSGARTGTLRIGWSTQATRAVASLRGTLNGRRVLLRMPAP
jgi:hypothetical protein